MFLRIITSPLVIFFSLIFCVIGAFLSVNRPKKEVVRLVITALILALVLTALSLLYREANYGGTMRWHYHGLPHYYFLQSGCVMDSLQCTVNEPYFYDFSGSVMHINITYLVLDLWFWAAFSYLLLVLSKKITAASITHERKSNV